MQGCRRRKTPPIPSMSAARPLFAKEIGRGRQWFSEQEYESCQITSFDGLTLRAHYLKGEGKTALLLMHGYHADSLYEFAPQLQFLHEQGFDLLLPDQRAHGQSDGQYLSFGVFESRDVADWAAWLDGTHQPQNIFLGGISMGGTSVTLASLQPLPDTVRGIIADCPFGNLKNQFRHSLSRRTGVLAPLFVYLCGIWSRLLAGWHFGSFFPSDLERATLPLLLLHGTADPTVPHTSSEDIAEYYGGKVRRELFEGCAHAYAYIKETERYQQLVLEFIECYEKR
ncbi:MAG: alpha/beta fold hydrolase [Clostridia bacterium]|nr:alpha/beta fold hydrolase [Clostridia bacterium]